MERLHEIGPLRDHIRHLNYAVATTTCRQTLGLLRQMLSEAEMKLHAGERNSSPQVPITPANGGLNQPSD